MPIDYEAWMHPTTDIVKRYADAFELNYHKSDDEIKGVFEKTIAEDVIKQRVHLINASYHTRVPLYEMTAHIKKHTELENLIKQGDADAVKTIAECGKKDYFVFATKYCCFGNKDKFPIFDSLSAKVLQYFFDKNDVFVDKIKFEKIKSRDYEEYREAVKMFVKHYNLKIDNYKMLDEFLWLVGKNMPNI